MLLRFKSDVDYSSQLVLTTIGKFVCSAR